MTPKLTRLGQTFDSHEELYFAAWLDEVKAAGLIRQWYRDVSPWPLTTGLQKDYTATKVLKTKTRTEQKTQTLLRPSSYTPDFRIVWDPSAHGVLYQTLQDEGRITKPFIADEGRQEWLSDVEIKPEFDRNNMTRLFVNNQKFVWERWKVYINLIHVTELFRNTFTPEEYLLTAQGKPRKTKWVVKPLKHYLSEL